MKILVSIATLMALAMSSIAQELPRPLQKPVLNTTSGVGYLIPGFFTTNIPTTSAPVFPFGKNGVGLALRVVGTNAATTTNLTAVFEQVIPWPDGTVQVVDSALSTITLSAAQNGTTPVDYFTNVVSTTAGMPNSLLRLRSIQNTNLASIWITNFVTTQLQ
jgi:hypothetical protein